MTDLFQFGWFSSHSKFQLPWKIDCDSLSDVSIEAIADLIRWKFAFSSVYGVPRGGCRLAEALKPYCEEEYPPLIVDDVLTTGRSMNTALSNTESIKHPIGVVIVARGICPNWIWPILSVNEWSQSRATGLG